MILMWAVYAHDRDLFKDLTRHNFHLICPNSNGQRICHNRTMQDPTVTRSFAQQRSTTFVFKSFNLYRLILFNSLYLVPNRDVLKS